MENTKINKIIWLTGISGVGKSTLANLIIKKFKKDKIKFLQIDGDIFRKKTKLKNSFTKKNIESNNNKIINNIKKNYKKFDFTIVSVISPLRKTRLKAYKLFNKNYYEIYVYCSMKTLIKRDPKGLYEKAKQNKIKNLIGYNSKIKYEKSIYKILKINTDLLNKKKSLDKILKKINYSTYILN